MNINCMNKIINLIPSLFAVFLLSLLIVHLSPTFGISKEDDTNVKYLHDTQELRSANLYEGLNKTAITMGGKRYPKSIMTHPEDKGVIGFVEYNLDGKFKSFHALAGMAETYPDHNSPSQKGCKNTKRMGYKVIVDGVTKAEGISLYDHRTININISGAKLLRLEVDDGGDSASCDWFSWANAYVVCDGPCPEEKKSEEKDLEESEKVEEKIEEEPELVLSLVSVSPEAYAQTEDSGLPLHKGNKITLNYILKN